MSYAEDYVSRVGSQSHMRRTMRGGYVMCGGLCMEDREAYTASLSKAYVACGLGWSLSRSQVHL